MFLFACPHSIGFFRFGDLKEKMLGLEFDSGEDLLHWIGGESVRIPAADFEVVFEEFIKGVEKNTFNAKEAIFLKTKQVRKQFLLKSIGTVNANL
jgi:hypothetical protein